MSDTPRREDAVRVAVRVRPLVDRDVAAGAQACVSVDEQLQCIVLGKDRRFTYDTVFGTAASEESIYSECVRPLVASCMEGFNATVLAYGQTGSGKTHTMRGLVPLVVEELFQGLSSAQQLHCLTGNGSALGVSVTLLEIYNEEIRDLLNPGTPSRSLVLRETPGGGGVYVTGAKEEGVASPQHLLALLEHAFSARATAQTSLNDVSSRSHMVCTITLRQARPVTAASTPGKSPPPSTPRTPTAAADEDGVCSGPAWAKLQLVDLAGSERTKRSLATSVINSPGAGPSAEAATASANARFREAININQGLLALGNVISALGDPRKAHVTHVPYRESKLTRLLQDSLGGNSRTLMLACISPADDCLDESLSTLKYAHRARNICNRPVATRPALAAAVERDLLAHQVEVLSTQLNLIRRIVNSLPLHMTGSLEAGYSLSTLLTLGHDLSSPGACAETLSALDSIQRNLAIEPPSRVDSHPVEMGFPDEDSYCFDARAGDEQLLSRFNELFRSTISVAKGMNQLGEAATEPDDARAGDQIQCLMQQASRLTLHGYEDEEGVLLGEPSELDHNKATPRDQISMDAAERSGLLAELGALAAERAELEVQCASLQEAATQQQSDFNLVREVLEERMRFLTTSIATQEELIQSLTLAEAQARQVNAACLERMAALEAEIDLKEREVQLLRDAIIEMEHDLKACSEEEQQALKQAAERDIAKAQDEVRALRLALQEASAQQQMLKHPNRAAAKVQSLESELKVLRSEQEVLRRRLTDRATQQERQLRAFQQEMASVKRAANVAQQRMVALAQESRAHQAMAKVKHDEALTARRRLRQLQAELDQARSPQHPRTRSGALPSHEPPKGQQRSTPTRDSPTARFQGSKGQSRHVAEATASPSPSPVGNSSEMRKARASVATNVSVLDSVVLKDLGLDLGVSRLEIAAALNAAPDEFRPILEQHIRAFSAQIAADRRINQLSLRQHRLRDHHNVLQAERTQLLRKLSMSGRYEAGDAPAGTACSPPAGAAAAAPPALADLDHKIDATEADLMYIDGVLKNLQRVTSRANTCIETLQTKMSNMGAQGCAATLQAILELFIHKQLQSHDKGVSSVRSSAAWPTTVPLPTAAVTTPAPASFKPSQVPDALPAVFKAISTPASASIAPQPPAPVPASPQLPRATTPQAAVTAMPQMPLACSSEHFTHGLVQPDAAPVSTAMPLQAEDTDTNTGVQQVTRHEEVSFGGSWTSSRGPSGGGVSLMMTAAPHVESVHLHNCVNTTAATPASNSDFQQPTMDPGSDTGNTLDSDLNCEIDASGPTEPLPGLPIEELGGHTADHLSEPLRQQVHLLDASCTATDSQQQVDESAAEQKPCPCPRKPAVVISVDEGSLPSARGSYVRMIKTPGAVSSRIPRAQAVDAAGAISPRGQSLVSAAHHVRNSSLHLQQPSTPSSPHQRSLSLTSYPSLSSPVTARSSPGGKPMLASPLRPAAPSPTSSRLNTQ